MIDLRSDTVTKPTNEMRKVMFEAKVGDDVYGEDPTVNELEKKSAEIIGMDNALFVPSGTMGNQIAILTHTYRGDEVITDTEAHIAKFEVGAPAMFAGVQLQLVSGLLTGNTVDKINKSYRMENIHFPVSRLLCLENTFNNGGGIVMPPKKSKDIYETAKKLSLKVHLDGARIFNAAVAAECDVKKFTINCDSIMFCLSKGLNAPVGSMLCGDNNFINKARKYRKAMGGGMRQAGILAAAGLAALNMIERLKEDHENARFLAEELYYMKDLKIDISKVQTNMVYVDTAESKINSYTLVDEMQKSGVGAIAIGSNRIRFVTHKEVSKNDIKQVIQIIKKIIN